MQEVWKIASKQASRLHGLQKENMHTLWETGSQDDWQDLQCVHEEQGKGMTSMNFGEFLFLCGMAITLGMAMSFGGLFGWAIFEWLKGVFQK